MQWDGMHVCREERDGMRSCTEDGNKCAPYTDRMQASACLRGARETRMQIERGKSGRVCPEDDSGWGRIDWMEKNDIRYSQAFRRRRMGWK